MREGYRCCDRCGLFTKIKEINLKGPTIVDSVHLCQTCIDEIGQMKV